MESKEDLRKKYISIRNNIQNKKEKSLKIFHKIINEEIYKKANVIAIYKSLPSEVDTSDLIEFSFIQGKTVVLPKTILNEIKFYKIDKNEKLIKSEFGVEEPEGLKEKLINDEKIDLIIVPGICFDKNGNRLGFGKGYYDRFLANTNIDTIGICFEEQIIEKVITDKYDVKIKKIITDGN